MQRRSVAHLCLAACGAGLLFLPSAHAQQAGSGTVVFSRSSDAQAPQQHAAKQLPAAFADSLTDAMRLAPRFTRYDFHIHLDALSDSLEVLLRTTIRNTGTTPLSVLPLQLSSSLHFEYVSQADGLPLPYAVHTVDSDADHTGELTEAAVQLARPIAPGAEAQFVVAYGGPMPVSSARLARAGAPAGPASQTDWDRISPDFTGLRGFGDTVWYPVSSIPALLGDGNKLFAEIDRQKAMGETATAGIDLTLAFMQQPPNLAVLDGDQVTVPAPLTPPTDFGAPGVLHLDLPAETLGYQVPSLLLANRANGGGNGLVTVAALPDHVTEAQHYVDASNLLQPLFKDWFGAPPAQPLLLVDLPVTGAAPAQDEDALLLSLAGTDTPQQLAGTLAAPVTRAFFRSPEPWLEEGVSGLMSLLWTERTVGREAALSALGSGYSSLALVEPSTPGSSPGQPLPDATDPVFYREKATAVLWMLRMMVGDPALSSALQAYEAGQDHGPAYLLALLHKSVAQQPEAPPDAAANLDWFFHDWIETDSGLPDLSIANVFSSKTGAGDQWLVAVDIANAGYAAAWVPVTVRSAATTQTTYVKVPARGDLSRRILLIGEPQEVDVNDGSVPEIEASIHRRILK